MMRFVAFVFVMTLAVAGNAMAQQQQPPQKTFEGYPCTKDCSGHEAGYKWAEDHDIDDPAKCGGTSQSFIEGCKAWANDAGADDNKSEEDADDGRED
jgi:hypothetical protein